MIINNYYINIYKTVNNFKTTINFIDNVVDNNINKDKDIKDSMIGTVIDILI
jgi:hypothetical protein